MFVGINTYEIESGIFNSEQSGKFYTVERENIHSTEHVLDTSTKVFVSLDIRLDTKVKHYKSITYGIIDAIGTLGGVFEILVWVLMIFYSSLREKMYLFFVINTIIQANKDEDAKSEADNLNNHAPITINNPDHAQRFNRVQNNKNQIQNNL